MGLRHDIVEGHSAFGEQGKGVVEGREQLQERTKQGSAKRDPAFS
jgi:hypothetical protein